MVDHLVISDTQVKVGVPLKHLDALANLIIDKTPDVIICIGDWWDMPSLSQYDVGRVAAEGQRYEQDIAAGNLAMAKFVEKIHGTYMPRLIFCMGNHEYRIHRHVEANPALSGKLSYDDFYLDGWEIYDFLKIVKVNGVMYSHYFPNPMTGKPYGGTAANILAKVGGSFTMGHIQKLDYSRKDLPDGRVQMGMITGAFYQHDESYKGPQGNHHWRGVIYKHDVKNGKYDFETYSLQRIMKYYSV